jgi:hypothetical protein
VLAAVVERGREVEEGGHVAVAGGEPLDALDRVRRQQRHRQPALGGHALLEAEVVGVELRRVDGQPARTRGGVHQHQRVADPLHGLHHAGRGLVVGQGLHVGVLGQRHLGHGPDGRLDDLGVLEPRRAARPPRTSS